jgi:osomolarity two-component system sensor histidine kinase SLN1
MEQNKFYNLIFMDIQMPNLDGLQSTRLIREMGYSAPIVALTAFAEESNVLECKDAGMDDFMSKPIKRPALKQVLSRYCPTIHEAAEETDSPPVAKKSAANRKAKRLVKAQDNASVDKDADPAPSSPMDEGVSPFTQAKPLGS